MKKILFKKGFTLTEILIVIGIIVILAGISIPVFRTYQPTLQLSGAVRDLITDIRYVQQMAVTEQINHGIFLYLDDNQYQIIKYKELEEVLFSKNLPETVSFYEIEGLIDNQIIFNPYGAIKESGNITLINTKQESKTIDIRPSGFVKIIK